MVLCSGAKSNTSKGIYEKGGNRTRKILKNYADGVRAVTRTPSGKIVNLAALRSCTGHYRGNLREDDADAVGNTRHNRTSRYGHEPRHQCILDEVLTALVFPNLQLQNKIFHIPLSPLP